MADITSNTTIDHTHTQGVKIVAFETPTDADNGDTIDVSGLFQDGCVGIAADDSSNVNLLDTSDGSNAWTNTITLPGSATSSQYKGVALGF